MQLIQHGLWADERNVRPVTAITSAATLPTMTGRAATRAVTWTTSAAERVGHSVAAVTTIAAVLTVTPRSAYASVQSVQQNA